MWPTIVLSMSFPCRNFCAENFVIVFCERKLLFTYLLTTYFQNWIARFGVPKCVTTDHGSQFESTLFFQLCNFIGCERIRTTAYHPAANEMVERLHRQLKADGEHWVDNLLILLLGIRSTFKPDINPCAAELVYGSTLRLPGEFLEHTTPPTLVW